MRTLPKGGVEPQFLEGGGERMRILPEGELSPNSSGGRRKDVDLAGEGS